MKFYLKVISFFLILLFSSGCGSDISSSGSNDNSPDLNLSDDDVIQITLSGVVVDGLISGAKVCLDNDPMDGECNINEPIATTNSSGEFDLGTAIIRVGTGISYVAYGGVDKATGKSFESKLRVLTQINEENQLVYVTPLTDLVATSFFKENSSSVSDLDKAQNKIAVAYGIQKELLYKNPLVYGGVFIKSQEIQQVKSIFDTVAKKTIDTEMTFPEKLALEEKIKQAILDSISSNNGYFKAQSTFEYLEDSLELSFLNNEKEFVERQLVKIRVDLDNFNNTFDTTDPRFDKYQIALEEKAQIAYDMINSADENDTLTPFNLNIDVYNDNPTDTNNTEDPTDNGNTDNSTELDVSFSGTVVDGYIKNAVLCIDKNLNGSCLDEQYLVTTDDNGEYTFNNVTLDKDSSIQIIATGGTDTFSQKVRTGSLNRVVSTNDLSTSNNLIISPITDLISTDFIRNGVSITESTLQISSKMGISSVILLSDTTEHLDLFLDSLYIEQIKKSTESLFSSKINVNNQYSLKDNIKAALLSGIKQGYDTTLPQRIVSSLMTSYETSVYTDVYYKLFDELDTIINQLKNSSDIKTYTLPIVQKVLEDKISKVSYSNINTADLNITIDTIIASDFDRTDATYDESSCKLTSYTNTLVDSNYTSEPQIDTNGNGISLTSNGQNVTIYYPDLGVSKSYSTIGYTKDPRYQIQLDEAWINQDKSIYIETINGDTNTSECYRIDLDSSTLSAEKVFSYSYN